MPRMRDLTELEQRILAFEDCWFQHPAAKETAIRELFDLSATEYFQRLHALLDEPAALVAKPVLVNRLRRNRDERRTRRHGAP